MSYVSELDRGNPGVKTFLIVWLIFVWKMRCLQIHNRKRRILTTTYRMDENRSFSVLLSRVHPISRYEPDVYGTLNADGDGRESNILLTMTITQHYKFCIRSTIIIVFFTWRNLPALVARQNTALSFATQQFR